MEVREKGSQYIIVPQGCLSFDGSDDYVTATSDYLTVANSYTASVTFRYRGTGSADKVYWTLFAKNDTGSGYDDNYHIWVASSSTDLFARMGSGTAGGISLDTNTAVGDGKWHTGTVVYNHSTKDFRLYVDGVSKVNKTVGANYTPATDTTHEFRLGEWKAYNNHFNGDICEFVFWSGTAFDSSEVNRIYNGITPTTPTVHYKFLDRENTTLTDSVNGIDGNIEGATWYERKIRCWNSRWDEDNYNVIMETFVDACDRNFLFRNVTPGAYRELYKILGKPTFIDTTYSSGNTLILEPIYGYGLSSLREKRTVAVRNISDTFVTPNKFGIKVEGIRLDID